MLRGGDAARRRAPASVVRAPGVVLEPEDVAEIVADAIAAETFLILPHPEVLDLPAAQGRRPRPLAGRDAQAAGPRAGRQLTPTAREGDAVRSAHERNRWTHRRAPSPPRRDRDRVARRPVGRRRPRRLARRAIDRLRRGDDRPRRQPHRVARVARRPRRRPGADHRRAARRRADVVARRPLPRVHVRPRREGPRRDAPRAADRRPRRGAHGRHDARRRRRPRVVARRRRGWRSPAAPATPATTPRTSAGQPPRKIETFFTRLDNVGLDRRPPLARLRRAPPTAPAPPRNLTPGAVPAPRRGVARPTRSGVVDRRAAPRRRGTSTSPRTSTSSRSTATIRALTKQTGSYGRPSVSPDGTTVAFLGFDDRRTTRRTPQSASSRSTGGAHRWISDGPRPHVRHDRRRRVRRSGSTTTPCSPPPRTAARPTCTGSAVGTAPTPERAHRPAPITVTGLRRRRRADRHGPGHRRAPGRDRRRSTGPSRRVDAASWPRVGAVHRPDHRRHRRDRRLDHAPGRLRAPPQVPGAAQRARRPVHPVRRDVLRRGPDAGGGRLRRA